MMGILPQQLYEMELWEYCACYRAFSKKEESKQLTDTITAWQTANFSGAAFVGKLKRLEQYLPKSEKKREKKTMTEAEFLEKLAIAKGEEPHGGT